MKRSFSLPFCSFIFLLGIIALCSPSVGAIPLNKETKKHENYTERIPDSKISFAMIAIPGGIYTLGSSETEKDRSISEGHQHSIEIQPFWMAKCEVTWDEYDLFRLSPGKDSEVLRELKSPDSDAVT